MRISTNYIYGTLRRTMQNSITNLLKAQEVMATQRRINRLSDDPVAAGRALSVNTMIEQHEQFLRNLGTADSWAELYDQSLGATVDVLKRAGRALVEQPWDE